MKNVSVRLDAETVEEIEDEADGRDISRAAYLREIIESRHESEALESEIERIRDEYETQVERLQNEKQALIEDREEKQELREYVEQEKSLVEKREERKQAPAWKRAKWWMFGTPGD